MRLPGPRPHPRLRERAITNKPTSAERIIRALAEAPTVTCRSDEVILTRASKVLTVAPETYPAVLVTITLPDPKRPIYQALLTEHGRLVVVVARFWTRALSVTEVEDRSARTPSQPLGGSSTSGRASITELVTVIGEYTPEGIARRKAYRESLEQQREQDRQEALQIAYERACRRIEHNRALAVEALLPGELTLDRVLDYFLPIPTIKESTDA